MSIVSSTGSLAALYTYSASWRRYDVSSSSDADAAATLADIDDSLAQASDSTAGSTTQALAPAVPEDSELDIAGLLQLLGSDAADAADELGDDDVAIAAPPPPPPPSQTASATGSVDADSDTVDAGFIALDTDGDGSVSLAEWQAGSSTSNDADGALQLAALARYASGQYQGVADLAAPSSGLLSVAV